MTDEIRDKVARLPAWARELIEELEHRSEPALERATKAEKSVANLQERNHKLENRIEAMVEMFKCAAKGENEIAKAVMRIVEDYILCDSE